MAKWVVRYTPEMDDIYIERYNEDDVLYRKVYIDASGRERRLFCVDESFANGFITTNPENVAYFLAHVFNINCYHSFKNIKFSEGVYYYGPDLSTNVEFQTTELKPFEFRSYIDVDHDMDSCEFKALRYELINGCVIDVFINDLVTGEIIVWFENKLIDALNTVLELPS